MQEINYTSSTSFAPLVARTFPHAGDDFMRYQFGRITYRRECHFKQETPIRVPVFHLLGFGRTAEAAQRMAEAHA